MHIFNALQPFTLRLYSQTFIVPRRHRQYRDDGVRDNVCRRNNCVGLPNVFDRLGLKPGAAALATGGVCVMREALPVLDCYYE
jgi:hypothetical protein